MRMQTPVPDFFQEETTDALRAQVDWQIREVGLDSAFFAKLLGTDERTFARWCASDALLPPGGEETLLELWRMVLHILTFQGYDPTRTREFFHLTMPVSTRPPGSPHTPPWCGMSLKAYLEQTRADGIEKVSDWVTGLWGGDPFMD